MSNERVNLDKVPTGNNLPEAAEFPLPSLRNFLMPGQLVSIKSFEASSLKELDDMINRWVYETASIIAIPSQLVKMIEASGDLYLITVTFVQASHGIANVKA